MRDEIVAVDDDDDLNVLRFDCGSTSHDTSAVCVMCGDI